MFGSHLFWRLYIGYVLIIVISSVVAGILLSRQLTENSLEEILDSLAVRSDMLAEVAKNSLANGAPALDEALLQSSLEKLGTDTRSRLTIMATDGRVIADSRELPATMDNHRQRPEVMDALELGTGFASRYSETLDQQMMYRAVAVRENEETLAVVRASLPLSSVEGRLQQLRFLIFLSASIGAIVALVPGFYFARRFTAPLAGMTETAEAISQGDYDRRITITHNDEVGQLAAAFNRMARSSFQRMNELTLDRNRLASILAGMVEGVIDVDEEQKIVHINQVAASLLGLTVEDCLQQPVWEVVRVVEVISALEQALGKREIVRARMRRPSGADDQVIDIYAASLQDEQAESIGAVIVLHDISELDHLERIRRDFVANASHELKTPISAIRGLTETVLDDADMPEETRQDFIEKAHAQCLRLSSLVTDLLTISRLEADHQEKKTNLFDLVALVRTSLAEHVEACDEKRIQVQSHLGNDPLMVRGDSQAISQLVNNLIDNAIKYTRAEGSITVAVARHSDKVVLSVQDSGIGISPQFQQRIFERFYRVDKARSRALGGTGLGLSIVKNIAERHGGSVSVESQPGSGSTFSVVLPLSRRASV